MTAPVPSSGLSAERVEEIERLRSGISDAPWMLDPQLRASAVYCDDALGSCVARCRPPRDVPTVLGARECDANAAFIAAAPEAVDDLLAEVRRLQGELAKEQRAVVSLASDLASAQGELASAREETAQAVRAEIEACARTAEETGEDASRLECSPAGTTRLIANAIRFRASLPGETADA